MLRRSTVIRARRATTLVSPGSTSMTPTVPTWAPPISVTRSRTRWVTAPAANPASWRIAIGVVPAWLACPRMVSSCQEMPCTPVTAPIVWPWRSRTGPCSMWSSTKAWGTRAGDRHRSPVADPVQLVAEHDAVGVGAVEGLLQRQAARVGHAPQHVGAEPGALLVGEEGHLDRSSGDDAGVVQRLDHLQPAEHAEVAVVAPAGGHGVDVAAGHHRGEVFAPRPPADDVADGVDADLEAEGLHPLHHQVPARLVGVGQGQPAAASVAGVADLRQRGQPSPQPLTVDPEPVEHPTSLPVPMCRSIRGAIRTKGDRLCPS